MTLSVLGAAALSGWLAQGMLVVASATAEARGTHLSTPDSPVGGPVAGALVLRPGITAAVENDGERGLALRAGYSPQLSAVAPASRPLLLLHTADVQGALDLTRRLRLRTSASSSLGDLDPATTQAALQRTSGVVDPLLRLPYASGTAQLGAAARLGRMIQLDLDARLAGAQTPGLDVLPATATISFDAVATWQMHHRDGLLFGARTRMSSIDERGSFSGAMPVLGWRHLFTRDAGLDVLVGAGPFLVNSVADGDRVWLIAPSGEVRVVALLDLPADAALELRGGVSVGPVADPLGALLEERLGGHVGALWRLTRAVSIRAEASLFGPLFTVARPPAMVADASLVSQSVASWDVGPRVALQASVLATTRWLDGAVLTDLTAGVALVTQAPVFHRGRRPAGTDPGLGRQLGATPLAAPPPPNALPDVTPLDESSSEPIEDPHSAARADAPLTAAPKVPAPAADASPPSEKQRPSGLRRKARPRQQEPSTEHEATPDPGPHQSRRGSTR